MSVALALSSLGGSRRWGESVEGPFVQNTTESLVLYQSKIKTRLVTTTQAAINLYITDEHSYVGCPMIYICKN
jgi:hypothetical protein